MDKVRGAVFSSVTLGFHLELEQARVLDLFAGSGAYGIEALSRGAAWADFVEREREAQDCIRHNLAAAKLESRGRLFAQDVFTWLKQFTKRSESGSVSPAKYDLVLADPPYDRPYQQAGESANEPDATAVLLLQTPWEEVLTPYGLLMLEQSIERPIDNVPGLEILRYRRYGKTLVIYYALPGAYAVQDAETPEDDNEDTAEP